MIHERICNALQGALDRGIRRSVYGISVQTQVGHTMTTKKCQSSVENVQASILRVQRMPPAARNGCQEVAR